MVLSGIIQAVLGVGLITIMFGIGLSLTLQDFINLTKAPRAVLVGLVAQLVGLPLAAMLVIKLLGVDPIFALGLMIIATSPGGATSNLFSFLMKADVALSVSLTAAASVLCVFTVPVVLSGAAGWLLGPQAIAVAPGTILVPLLVVVLIPLLVGMVVRARRAEWAQQMESPTKRLSVAILVGSIAYVVYVERDRLSDTLLSHGPTVVLFMACAAGLGRLVAGLARLPKKQARTIVIEVGIQNGVQAIFIATSPMIFDNPALAVPAAIYSLLMYFMMAVLYGLYRGDA